MKLEKSASYYYLVRMCSKIYVEEKWSHQDAHGQLFTSCTATRWSAEILGRAVEGPVVPADLAAAFAAAAAGVAAFCWALARREQTLFLRKNDFTISFR